MQTEVINIFKERAMRTGEGVCRHLPKQGRFVNDWSNYRHPTALNNYRIIADGHIRFIWNQHAFVEFIGIVPRDIIGEPVFDEPVLTGTETYDNNTSRITNSHSSVSLDQTYDLTISEQTQASHTVGASILTEVKTKIGTGAASPVAAELQFRTQVTAKYEAKFVTTNTTARKVVTKAHIPANTSATIVTNQARANFSQRVRCNCFLDSKIRIFSRDDFDYTWLNADEFHEVTQGASPEQRDDGSAIPLATWYRGGGRQLNELDRNWLTGLDLPVALDKRVTYSDARVGDITITDPS